MKTLPPALQEHIQSGVTTLATCWILRRSDGAAIGFTDHDLSLTVQDVLCEPQAGLTGSEIRQSDGFASDDQDISGILVSDRITEADLISGRYDAATIETWRVNWQDTQQSVLLRKGYLGEIKRDRQAFQAEVRGLSVELEQERGRIYQSGCDATLGDARCGVDLAASGLSFEGYINATPSLTDMELMLASRPESGHLCMGRMDILSGKGQGMSFDILSHSAVGEIDRIELWTALHTDISLGDQVCVSVGCDKCFSTCRSRFANQLNFRGFPHIPGNDFVLSFPGQAQDKDGSALMVDQ